MITNYQHPPPPIVGWGVEPYTSEWIKSKIVKEVYSFAVNDRERCFPSIHDKQETTDSDLISPSTWDWARS